MQLVINSPGTFITQKNECFRLKQKGYSKRTKKIKNELN